MLYVIKTRVDNLVMQTPAHDLTNILNEIENLEPDKCKEKIGESSKVMAYLANRATKEYPQIRKVIVVARVPRVDKLEKHNQLANTILKEEIEKLGNNKIVFCEHNIANQGFTKEQVFGPPGGRNDGTHCNGENGEVSVRNSFVNIFKEHITVRNSTGN